MTCGDRAFFRRLAGMSPFSRGHFFREPLYLDDATTPHEHLVQFRGFGVVEVVDRRGGVAFATRHSSDPPEVFALGGDREAQDHRAQVGWVRALSVDSSVCNGM